MGAHRSVVCSFSEVLIGGEGHQPVFSIACRGLSDMGSWGFWHPSLRQLQGLE